MCLVSSPKPLLPKSWTVALSTRRAMCTLEYLVRQHSAVVSMETWFRDLGRGSPQRTWSCTHDVTLYTMHLQATCTEAVHRLRTVRVCGPVRRPRHSKRWTNPSAEPSATMSTTTPPADLARQRKVAAQSGQSRVYVSSTQATLSGPDAHPANF